MPLMSVICFSRIVVMKTFTLALFLVALAFAGIAPPIPNRTCPLTTRNELLTCITQMDLDQDDTITEAELDTFLSAHTSCIPTAVRAVLTGAAIIGQCDTDASGNLTMTDWTAPTGCFQLRSRQMSLCRACDKCGLFNVILKKKNEK
jgi:hypothetical protein